MSAGLLLPVLSPRRQARGSAAAMLADASLALGGWGKFQAELELECSTRIVHSSVAPEAASTTDETDVHDENVTPGGSFFTFFFPVEAGDFILHLYTSDRRVSEIALRSFATGKKSSSLEHNVLSAARFSVNIYRGGSPVTSVRDCTQLRQFAWSKELQRACEEETLTKKLGDQIIADLRSLRY